MSEHDSTLYPTAIDTFRVPSFDATPSTSVRNFFTKLAAAVVAVETQLTAAEPSTILTTRGDLLREGATGPERVALGATGLLLGSDGTDAKWVGTVTTYTQTYATASATVAAPTAATVTDNSGGSSGGTTIAAVGGAVDPTAALKADTANAIATLAAMVNKLTADALDNKKNITAIIDNLQTYGIGA